MQNDLKIQLERFDKGEITIKMFVENVRKISQKPNQTLVSKEEIIQEYLEQQKSLQDKKHIEDNRKAYQKWVSNPENKKRRAKLDKARYERTKSIGNTKA